LNVVETMPVLSLTAVSGSMASPPTELSENSTATPATGFAWPSVTRNEMVDCSGRVDARTPIVWGDELANTNPRGTEVGVIVGVSVNVGVACGVEVAVGG